MGQILDELLNEIKRIDLDEQVRIVCDDITKEEIKNPDDYDGPTGPNIFLSLPVETSDKKYDNYLCLERESKGVFVISHWTCFKGNDMANPKKVNVWESNYDKANRIIKEYVEKLSFIKGE